MAEICKVCNKKIGFLDTDIEIGKIHLHHDCLATFEADPEKYRGKAKKELTPREEVQNKEEQSKGMVLTDIDLPFGRVFWVTVQFFGAGLVLAIPLWIIFFLIVSN